MTPQPRIVALSIAAGGGPAGAMDEQRGAAWKQENSDCPEADPATPEPGGSTT